MKITFHGGAGTVTGSKFLVQSNGTRVLVDCGIFQGLKTLRLKNWAKCPEDILQAEAVILTHAHIDHSGYLPVLVKEGFQGPIYCTPATFELCKILLPDAGRIQEEDTAYANKKGYSKHKPALPLFTEDDAYKSLKHFHPVNFHQELLIGDFQVNFYKAGHILGASSVTLKNQQTVLAFSGDLGRSNDLIMHPPEHIPQADWIICESTYGDRNHPDSDGHEEMAAAINATLSRGGTVLIPSFAVGRAQAILYLLHKLIESNQIPNVPIFIDSPMATDATEVFLRYSDEHRLSVEETHQVCQRARYINTQKESIALSENRHPAIIISASGMLTGGRVLHHLEHLGTKNKNSIILVGYQAPGTRGASLLEGDRLLKVHGHQIQVSAEVYYINAFSAHADQKQLLDWLKSSTEHTRGVILVHGEPESLDKFRRKIEETLHLPVLVAEAGQSLDLK